MFFSPSEATLISAVLEKFDQGNIKDMGITNITIEPGADSIRIYEYSFTTSSEPFNPIKSCQFGMSFNMPLLAVVADAGQEGSLKAPSLPFFKVDKPNIIIVNVKRTEFGDPDDIIIRLQEISGNQIDFYQNKCFRN